MYTEIVSRAKKQPRHGQAGNSLQQVQQQLVDIFDLYKSSGTDVVRLNIFGELANQVSNLGSTIGILEQRNSQLASSWNTNAVGAAKYGVAIENLAVAQNVNVDLAKQYVAALKDTYAGQVKRITADKTLGPLIIKQNDQLRNQIKLSEDANAKFLIYQDRLTKGLTDPEREKKFLQIQNEFASVAKALEDAGMEGALNEILEDFAALGPEMRMTFGKVPKDIALAIGKSKTLGIAIEDIVSGAKGLFDIEKAIGDQIELQVLGGERLTDNQGNDLAAAIQQASLQKDSVRLQELYQHAVEKSSKLIQQNPFYAEKLASFLGISEEKVFEMAENIERFGDKAPDAVNAVKPLLDLGRGDIKISGQAFEEQVAEAEQRLLGDIAVDKVSVAEAKGMGDYSGKVETNRAGFEQAIDPLVTGLAARTDNLLRAAAPVIDLAFGVLGTGKILTSLASKLTDGSLMQVDQTGNKLFNVQKKEDMFMPASDDTVISGPLGTFSLHPKDDVLAMPNIGKTVGRLSSGNSDGASIAGAVASALKGMTFHVTNVFDGQKIRSSLAILDQSTLNNTNII